MGNWLVKTFYNVSGRINTYYFDNISDNNTHRIDVTTLPSIITELFKDYDLDWVIPNDENNIPDQQQLIDSQLVYNEENVGVLEEKLPHEMIFYILTFLPFESLFRLGRVSKNFRNYWIELPQLWKLRSDSTLASECMMPFCPVYSKINPIMNSLFFQKGMKVRLSNAFTLSEQESDLVKCPIIVLFVGLDKCGKSQYISKSIRRENFTDFYIPTIGLDCCTCKYQYRNILYNFNSWDTSGQERFKFVNSTLHSKARINCFCFSLNDYSSFERCKENFNDWKKRNAENNVMEHLKENNRCVLILGLKADLEQKVPPQEIKQFFLDGLEPSNCRLYSNRVQYFRLSSKNDSYEDLMVPLLYARSILEKENYKI